MATFNVWGIEPISILSEKLIRIRPGEVRHKDFRLREFCEELKRQAAKKNGGFDLILLQEVWELEDQARLANCGFHSAQFDQDRGYKKDSGLMILSRYPLSQLDRLTFPPYASLRDAFSDGEGFAHKSVVVAKILHPELGAIWVGNTHLASMHHDFQRYYREARQKQFELASKWLLEKAGEAPTIFGGDFNFGPYLGGVRTYERIYDRIGFDLLLGFQKTDLEGPLEEVCTICRSNSYKRRNDGKVDHILFSEHFSIEDMGQVFQKRIPMEKGIKINYSDHFGWEASAWLERDKWPQPLVTFDPREDRPALKQANHGHSTFPLNERLTHAFLVPQK